MSLSATNYRSTNRLKKTQSYTAVFFWLNLIPLFTCKIAIYKFNLEIRSKVTDFKNQVNISFVLIVNNVL